MSESKPWMLGKPRQLLRFENFQLKKARKMKVPQIMLLWKKTSYENEKLKVRWLLSQRETSLPYNREK
ncbi:MAG: hypothetical protein ACFFFH_09675 [Candidatus Thorarchaeota archaeon]